MNAVIQAYRFALDPTPEQDAVLRSHCGGQRFAFNWGLALVTAVMDQRKAEASYGIPDAELTPSLNWSAYSLRKLWNQAKGTTAPWWAENSKEAYSSGLANLATALSNSEPRGLYPNLCSRSADRPRFPQRESTPAGSRR